MHAHRTPDHPDIAAAPARGPRCKFGRPHFWQSLAREGVVTPDVFECITCGAVSDEREEASACEFVPGCNEDVVGTDHEGTRRCAIHGPVACGSPFASAQEVE